MSAPKGHAGAVGNKPRCHECNHPGGDRRRLSRNKKPCSCSCHSIGETMRPIPIDTTLQVPEEADVAFDVRPESEVGEDE